MGYEIEEIQIQGLRFCKWNRLDDSLKKGSFSWHFPVVCLGSVGLLLGISKIVYERTLQGDFTTARVFAIGMLLLLYVAMLLPLALLLLRRKSVAEWPVGRGIPVTVTIKHDGSASGGSKGWLRFERSQMVFEGERFCFALGRDQFKSSKLAKALLAGTAYLNLPKGFPSVSLLVVPYADHRSARELRQELLFQVESLPSSSEPAIYPPLDSGSRPVPLARITVICASLGVLAGLGAQGLPLLFPLMSEDRSTNLFLPVFLLVMMFPLMVWIDNFAIHRKNKKAERLRRGAT